MPDNSIIQKGRNDSTVSSTERDRHIGDFLRELSHELGNVAFPLRMIVEMQSRSGHLSTEELNEVLQHQVHALQIITKRSQIIGRCLSGNLGPLFEPVPASDILREAADSQGDAVKEFGHTLSLSTCDDAVHVIGDRDLLIQALSELIHNAVRFTPAGGRIEVAMHAEQNVQFVVRDNGPGVPPAMLPQIFEPFMVGCDRMDVGAGHLGCGLTLVRHVMAAHRGMVELRRTSSAGSEFAIVIPRKT